MVLFLLEKEGDLLNHREQLMIEKQKKHRTIHESDKNKKEKMMNREEVLENMHVGRDTYKRVAYEPNLV